MLKKLVLSSLAVFAAALTLPAQNISFDFDIAEQWTAGDPVNSGSGILAQSSFVMQDVAADPALPDNPSGLHAYSAGNFQNAVFFTPNTDTFDVGDSITIEASLALADRSAFTGEKNFARIGLRTSYTNGAPTVGIDLTANALWATKISEIGGTEKTNVGSTDDLFHTYTTVITKTAVENTFEMSASRDGGDTISYSIVNSALYAASNAYAAINTRAGPTTGGILMDSFSVSTTSAVPEPSTYASIFGLIALAFVVSRRKRD
tara:strand:- start:473 stop:1258 length:786 start_codon:yes stop_codon:yes gene_type:complete